MKHRSHGPHRRSAIKTLGTFRDIVVNELGSRYDANKMFLDVWTYIVRIEDALEDAFDLRDACLAIKEAKEKGTITLEQLEDECGLKLKKKQSN